MKKDNRGLSLIELIVVIAIMAIFTGVVGLSLSMVSRRKVSNAALQMKEEIVLARSYARSKGECKVTIQGTANEGSKVFIYTGNKGTLDNVFMDSAIPTGCKLGNGPEYVYKKIKTTIIIDDGSGTNKRLEVGDNDLIDIHFNRSLGGFGTCYYAKSVTGSVVDVSEFDAAGSATRIKGTPVAIEFSNGERKAVLNFATYTGTVTINYEDV